MVIKQVPAKCSWVLGVCAHHHRALYQTARKVPSLVRQQAYLKVNKDDTCGWLVGSVRV